MALINCPECGKEISDQAVACPNCGLPINASKNIRSKQSIIPREKMAPLVLILIVSGLMFVRMIFVFSSDVSDYTQSDNAIEKYVVESTYSIESEMDVANRNQTIDDAFKMRKGAYILFILLFVTLLIEIFALHRYDSKVLNLMHLFYLICILWDIIMSVGIYVTLNNSSNDEENALEFKGLILAIVAIIVFLIIRSYTKKAMDESDILTA